MLNKYPIPPKISKLWISQNFSAKSGIGKEIFDIIKIFKQKKEKVFIKNFKLWKVELSLILPQKDLSEDLYCKHTLLTIVLHFILEYMFKNDFKNKENIIKSLLKIPTSLSWPFDIAKLMDLYNQCLKLFIREKPTILNEDIFSSLYQELITITERHHIGEFYTHSELARIMVEDSYLFQDKVLDPACGSGTFLVEIIRLIENLSKNKTKEETEKAIKNLKGVDINPISCMMARSNIIFHYIKIFPDSHFEDLENISNNISNTNTLFPRNTQNLKQHDYNLIIGNPPWLVLNRISSKKEKNRIKNLGKDLGILRGGKLSTSTELTTIFCYKCVNDYLRDEGRIFIVVPASLATGSQHALFRQFVNLKNIRFWAFEKDVFRIHNLCFYAQKGKEKFENRMKIQWDIFRTEEDPISVELKKSEIYSPISIRNKSSSFTLTNLDSIKEPDQKVFIGRLISTKEKANYKLFNEFENSQYKKEFRQGASLIPRNILLIDIKSEKKDNSETICEITPSKYIQTKKYSTWEFDAYHSAKTEKDYLFKIAKSTGLIPFYYFQDYDVFLPLERSNNGEFKLKEPSKPFARKHFQFLDKLYKQNLKKDAKIRTLCNRIDYGHALTNSLQTKIPKVIYAGIGSIVKSALLKDMKFIDTSLYYYTPESEDEAYYLIGYLNSNILTKHLKVTGSTGAHGSLRNIHKHPLSFRLPLFDMSKKSHCELSERSKEIELYVKNLVKKIIKIEPIITEKVKSIQNRVVNDKKYQEMLIQLDSNVLDVFKLGKS